MAAIVRRASRFPAYHQGFARSPGQSAHPSMWRNLVFACVPALGRTGTTVPDASLHNHQGSFVDAPTWGIASGSRLHGHALSFDGTDDRIDIDATAFPAIAVTGRYTAVMRGRNANFDAWGTLLQMDAGNPDSRPFIIVYAHTTTNGAWGPVTAGISWGWESVNNVDEVNLHSLDNVLVANRWWHIVLTYNGQLAQANRFTIYVDGIDVTDTGDIRDLGSLATIDVARIQFGEDRFGDWFEGDLAEFRWYDRLLTPSEIFLDYALPLSPFRLRPGFAEIPAAPVGGRIMSSLVYRGGLAAEGGLAGIGGGLAG